MEKLFRTTSLPLQKGVFMTILITGATGLIGKEIVKLYQRNHINIHYLTTSKSKLNTSEKYKGFYWNPKKGEIDHACFKGVSAIVNLVGASISKRWTSAYKKEVLESRTLTAKFLQDTIRKHNYKIDHVVSASAIGIYPSSFNTIYSEDDNKVSTSFLGEVVDAWEKAVDQFTDLGVKVAKIRIGLVLSIKGGALPEIVKPIKLGVGAAFGDGKQWQSWIHIKDLASMFVFILQNQLEGVFNGTAPNPVTNKTFTKITAEVLSKPLMLPNIPKFVMKMALGEMHILLFESQKVSSQKIESEGFQFSFKKLKPALEDLLKQPSKINLD